MELNIFKKYWDILKKNYQDKTHNTEELKMYFSIFKDYSEEDFKNAIKQVLKYQSYFPRVDEIVKYLPYEEQPKWLNENLQKEEMTIEEQKEWDELIGGLCEENNITR